MWGEVVNGGGCEAHARARGGGCGGWRSRMVDRARRKEVRRWEFGAGVGRWWVVQQNCAPFDIALEISRGGFVVWMTKSRRDSSRMTIKFESSGDEILG